MKKLPSVSPGGRAIVVLVVDDSAVARQMLKAIIEEGPEFRALTAGDPYEAVAVMRKTAPAVIVLDVNMPRMDGITFLEKLMRQHPLPVLLCTDHPERGLAGLDLGALEVIPKPNWNDPAELDSFAFHLRESLRQAIGILSGRPEPPVETRPSPSSRDVEVILPRVRHRQVVGARNRLIAIGASTGGVQAVTHLLADLGPNLPGIVIVQHMPGSFTKAFADRLDSDPHIRLRVVEAGPNHVIEPGTVVVVPGTAHGVVHRHGLGYRLSLIDGPIVNRFKPSIDVLFRSVGQAAGANAAGVILTGMLNDGAQGLLEMSEDGALTIAQDQATSVVFGMPREAIRRGAARAVLPLDKIGPALTAWANNR